MIKNKSQGEGEDIHSLLFSLKYLLIIIFLQPNAKSLLDEHKNAKSEKKKYRYKTK